MTVKPSILIIENDGHLHGSLAPVLHQAGYLVATTSPSAGVAKLAVVWPCDLVLIDIDELDSKGLKLASEIHRQSPEVHVLLLTGQPLSDHFLANLEDGAFDFLVKPVKPVQILDTVVDLLSHRIHPHDLPQVGW